MREVRAGGHREHQNLLLPASEQWGDVGGDRGHNPTPAQVPSLGAGTRGTSHMFRLTPTNRCVIGSSRGKPRTPLRSCRASTAPSSDFQPLGQRGQPGPPSANTSAEGISLLPWLLGGVPRSHLGEHRRHLGLSITCLRAGSDKHHQQHFHLWHCR